VSTAVNLNADDAIGSDVFFGFCVVGGLHSIDPCLNAWSVRFDDIIVPVIGFEDGTQFFDVGLCNDAIPSAFVIDGTVPVWFAEVALIT
ncbi:MAG: hypothetical protein RIS92_895, partial [Verrucomicrobiota bacterium]